MKAARQARVSREKSEVRYHLHEGVLDPTWRLEAPVKASRQPGHHYLQVRGYEDLSHALHRVLSLPSGSYRKKSPTHLQLSIRPTRPTRWTRQGDQRRSLKGRGHDDRPWRKGFRRQSRETDRRSRLIHRWAHPRDPASKSLGRGRRPQPGRAGSKRPLVYCTAVLLCCLRLVQEEAMGAWSTKRVTSGWLRELKKATRMSKLKLGLMA